MKIQRWAPTLALLACTSCTGDVEFHLDGTWQGQWSSGTTIGSLRVDFGDEREFGDMKLFNVTLSATGPACPSGQDSGSGQDTAAFLNDDVHFAVRMDGGAPGGEGGVFLFDGVLNGGREIDGTYRLSGEACDWCVCGMGSSGTWRLLR